MTVGLDQTYLVVSCHISESHDSHVTVGLGRHVTVESHVGHMTVTENENGTLKRVMGQSCDSHVTVGFLTIM